MPSAIALRFCTRRRGLFTVFLSAQTLDDLSRFQPEMSLNSFSPRKLRARTTNWGDMALTEPENLLQFPDFRRRYEVLRPVIDFVYGDTGDTNTILLRSGVVLREIRATRKRHTAGKCGCNNCDNNKASVGCNDNFRPETV